MSKYSDKQLANLAEGVFKCSPKEPVFYACSNGTFLNSRQYAKLSDKDKEDYKPFKNPNLKAPEAADVDAAKAEAAAAAKAEKAEKEAAAKAAAAAKAEAKKAKS
jgi:hypothetical protein